MRRLTTFLRWWQSRQREHIPFAEPRQVIIEQPMDTLVQYEPVGPLPAPPPVPTEPWDWSGYDVEAVCEAISHARQRWHTCWPIDLDEPPPPTSPRIRALITEMTREATASQATGLLAFTARHVPLMRGMDAEAISEWHPIIQMILRTALACMYPNLRTRLTTMRIVDATLTIYAPREWVASKPLRIIVEKHLLAAVSSAIGVQVGDLIQANWEESDGPFLWNVELWDSADWQEVAA